MSYKVKKAFGKKKVGDLIPSLPTDVADTLISQGLITEVKEKKVINKKEN